MARPNRLKKDFGQSALLTVVEGGPADPSAAPATKKKRGKTDLSPLLGEGDRVDWNSPLIIINLTKKIRGEIGLDPCSNFKSKVNAKTEWMLERGEDGLQRSWAGFGLVYDNPPYGDEIVPFINKAAREGGRNSKQAELGEFSTEIVSLLPARTDTQWFSTMWRSARCVAFWRGRLTFLGAPDPAPFPSMLPYYGPNPYRFADIFSPYAEISFL